MSLLTPNLIYIKHHGNLAMLLCVMNPVYLVLPSACIYRFDATSMGRFCQLIMLLLHINVCTTSAQLTLFIVAILSVMMLVLHAHGTPSGNPCDIPCGVSCHDVSIVPFYDLVKLWPLLDCL